MITPAQRGFAPRVTVTYRRYWRRLLLERSHASRCDHECNSRQSVSLPCRVVIVHGGRESTPPPAAGSMMTIDDSRRRPRPADRFAGTEHLLDMSETLRALRIEKSPGASGHRQITLLHEGPVRLVLFAFDSDGRMPEHRAPGWVTIQVMRGALQVQTAEHQHLLTEGQMLALAPNTLHDVHATEESDMLLGVYPELAALPVST